MRILLFSVLIFGARLGYVVQSKIRVVNDIFSWHHWHWINLVVLRHLWIPGFNWLTLFNCRFPKSFRADLSYITSMLFLLAATNNADLVGDSIAYKYTRIVALRIWLWKLRRTLMACAANYVVNIYKLKQFVNMVLARSILIY
jgi:hypothetical protein